MRLLYKGDPCAVEISERVSFRPDTEYRLSHFVHSLETEGKVLIINTLTRQVYELDNSEWADLKTGRLPQEDRDTLARFCCLVETDYDELEQYFLLLNTLRAVIKKPAGISYFTILPTTACNARCVYCYEEGMVPVSMTAETADSAADFICRTKRDGPVTIHWFGGEPLMGASVISRICRRLNDKGVDFTSNITTNGSLFTNELAQEARDLWKLKNVQLSMDGARSDYEKRKRYIDPLRHNYDAALKAAELFADIGASVSIRCNYDSDNLPRVTEFFSECHERFHEKEKVKIYMAQLFQSAGDEKSNMLYHSAMDAESHLDEYGMLISRHLETQLVTHHCMADSIGSSIIIDPAGGLHNCELELDSAPLGTIFDDSLPAWPKYPDEVMDICRDCCFLPDCTPFRKRFCPITPFSCKEQMAVITDHDLLALLNEGQTQKCETAETVESSDDNGATDPDEIQRRAVLC